MDAGLELALDEVFGALTALKSSLRQRYREPNRQVTAKDLKADAGRLAERWLTRLSRDPPLVAAVDKDLVANLTVQFQRLLVISEKAAQRNSYDAALTTILRQFRSDVIIPVKAAAASVQAAAPGAPTRPLRASNRAAIPRAGSGPVIFLAHSFESNDVALVTTLRRLLEAIGFEIITGEKPRAGSISEKVRDRIDSADVFVGVFTRREKLARSKLFNTSLWLVDEKAYALARGMKLILLKESGVASIGGIHGDYEYLEFARNTLADLMPKVLELFSFDNVRLV